MFRQLNILLNSLFFGLIVCLPFHSVLAQQGVPQAYNVVYHRCFWNIDVWTGNITGYVCTYYKSEVPEFNTGSFDFSSNMVLDSVKWHGQSLNNQHPDNKIIFEIPVNLTTGQLDSVIVYYHGQPLAGGFGSFEAGQLLNTQMCWSLSEPYGAPDWWPCKQSLNDKIDSLDVFVENDSSFRASSNGLRVAEFNYQNKRFTHWKHRYPIATYLVAVAVGKYSDYDEHVVLSDGTSLLVQNMIVNDAANILSWHNALPPMLPVIRFYDSLLIPYPFKKEKYGHTQVNISGGMEHQTNTFFNQIQNEVFSHELAHQWFGNRVTCASWQDIWLNEGIATYFGGLAYKYVFHQYFESWLNEKMDFACSQPNGSVFCDDTTLVNRIFDSRLTYAKGGMVMRMLEWELGQANFYQALRNYLNDSALVGSFAHTSDLISHFETQADTSLTEFFSDWYYNQGYPLYSFVWHAQPDGQVDLTISQSQSHPSVSFFDMDLPFKFTNGAQDTMVVVHNNLNGQQYTFHLTFEPSDMIFDPDHYILTPPPHMRNVPSDNCGEFS